MSGTVLNRRHGHDIGTSGQPQGYSSFGGVERVVLSLPEGVYASVPDDPAGGLGLFGTGAGGAVIDSAAAATSAVQGIDLSYLVPELLAVVKRGAPVRAIAIAADSPISECDLWLGDVSKGNRYRLSPGRPLVGDISSLDHLNVTLPRTVPNPWDDLANADTVANWSVSNIPWGASSQVLTPAGPEPRVDTAWPLRLELYRGELPPVIFRERAPEYADAWVNIDLGFAANPAYGKLWVPTHGRRFFEVVAVNRNAASQAQVTVFGYTSTLAKRFAGRPMSLRRSVSGVLVEQFDLGPNGDFARRAYNNRFDMIAVKVEPSPNTDAATTTCTVSVHVTARDS